MKALELDYGQTLFMQQEQKAKEQKIATQRLKEQQNQKELQDQMEKAKKEKIEEFIRDREEEVLELIPSFIKANRFLLQQSKIDLEDREELLKVIK